MPRFRRNPPLFGRRRLTHRQQEQGCIGLLALFVFLLLIGVCG